MKIAVWDTYVERENGAVMHFDILVPNTMTNEQEIFNYGKSYLKNKPFQTGQLSAEECRLCHIQQAPKDIISSIEKKGYYIIEMENCD